MKKTVSILLALMLMLSLSVTAFADEDVVDGSVVYKGGAEKFVYTPAMTDYTVTDMFNEGFKNYMPGDVVKGLVGVGNLKNNDLKYTIQMRAVAHDKENNPLTVGETVERNTEFLSVFNLEIVNKANGKVIFNDQPWVGDVSPEENWITLGTFKKGQGTTLELTLTSDIEKMDNSFANRIGEVDWQFRVIEIPGPQTGDDSHIGLYLALCGLSVVTVGATLVLKKKLS